MLGRWSQLQKCLKPTPKPADMLNSEFWKKAGERRTRGRHLWFSSQSNRGAFPYFFYV
jgi:hypothetical protein